MISNVTDLEEYQACDSFHLSLGRLQDVRMDEAIPGLELQIVDSVELFIINILTRRLCPIVASRPDK